MGNDFGPMGMTAAAVGKLSPLNGPVRDLHIRRCENGYVVTKHGNQEFVCPTWQDLVDCISGHLIRSKSSPDF